MLVDGGVFYYDLESLFVSIEVVFGGVLVLVGKCVLIVCGDGGCEWFVEWLCEVGVDVMFVVVYWCVVLELCVGVWECVYVLFDG